MSLETVRDVVEALGGLRAVSDLTGADYGTVSAWQVRLHYFPPKTYVVMTEALRGLGKSAPPSLWRMVDGPSPVTADESAA